MPPQPETAARPSPGVLEIDRGFVVATGIECSAPIVASGSRQDELVLTGHVERFAEDLSITAPLAREYHGRLGLPFLSAESNRTARRRPVAGVDEALANDAQDGRIERLGELLEKTA